jgi:energy-coupling factor transport system ATP-binding protein
MTERVAARARGLLDVLGLSSQADMSPYHLSGGEQRRLMVAAALAHGPLGVLLDEPTIGQDRATWSAVVGIVSAARDAGGALALSTHDTAAVRVAADSLVRLDDGRVVV